MTANQSMQLRSTIQSAYLGDETDVVQRLIKELALDEQTRARICGEAVKIVEQLRTSATPGMMEVFLAEYGLTTQEGVALMCMAEALLRVPDDITIDALIQDKIAPADWSSHLGHSSSPLVNSSTWALLLTGKIIQDQESDKWDITGTIRGLIKRAGEPVIRKAVAQSMKILGHQFVLGRNIDDAMERAEGMEKKGYTYSYDMLGEAARTAEDAKRYFMAYSKAISNISDKCNADDIRDNPGISVKLSALHPRYEFAKHDRVMNELVPRLSSLVHQAKNANMGFNIDAEEADRLDISLDVIEAVLSNPDLKGWDGFGVVVQAYGPRAGYTIDWLYDLASRLDRKIMVRLVKGAYWDAEVKLSQVNGLDAYPVFTRKSSTDISYMANAKKLLSMTDRIYPQFATHNAHSVATILELAGTEDNYEFQRLHGMGEALHRVVKEAHKGRCRIYAPVGIHEDLLAYLVRRLLENGANSSFVNQVLDENVPAAEVVKDPVAYVLAQDTIPNPKIPNPLKIYAEGRTNSKGINIANPPVLAELEEKRGIYRTTKWQASPIVGGVLLEGTKIPVFNPSNREDMVGEVIEANAEQVEIAIAKAQAAQASWAQTPAKERAACLNRIADLYEDNTAELMAMVSREAGKSILDGIAEIREAVDFCRFYALRAVELEDSTDLAARGLFTCISPWNFPLAIFTGQIVAALATGNAVLAKPAEQTPLVASKAVELMHKAGIPGDVLALLPGQGHSVGAKLTSDSRISGVCFTGSTQTAQLIHKAMAENMDPQAPLIAETGGMNAMIVDSTALPEQAIRDVLASSFQSAGQRCSALRMLYVQEDVADKVIHMLKGAMDELEINDPWSIQTDVGPVIDEEARKTIEDHCQKMEAEGRLIKKLDIAAVKDKGTYVAPAVYRVNGIEDLEQEIFGPILHVATFKAADLLKVVDNVNAMKYGLTFGIHTRVNRRVQKVCERARVGNLYVNRNQIGAVVGVQPFGGEGLSGTGPKAGGPLYLRRFVAPQPLVNNAPVTLTDGSKGTADVAAINAVLPELADKQVAWDSRDDRLLQLNKLADADGNILCEVAQQVRKNLIGYHFDTEELMGPTGESNKLANHGRGVMICCGQDAAYYALMALACGNTALLVDAPVDQANALAKAFGDVVKVANGSLNGLDLSGLGWFAGVAFNPSEYDVRVIRKQLATREGAILSVLCDKQDWAGFVTERTLCVDTTASGGNAALLASA